MAQQIQHHISGPLEKPKKRPTNQGRAKWLAFRKEYLKGRETVYGKYQCEWCGGFTDHPELDHIKLRSTHAHRVYDPTNIRLLCWDCHHRRHK